MLCHSILLLASTITAALADVCSLTRKVNGYRSTYKLTPLVLDVRLVQVAQDHSEEMASHSVTSEHEASLLNKQQQHDSNDLSAADSASSTAKQDAWYANIESLIPNWTFLAENVAMGSHDENAILDLFKNTKDYNENLLSDEATLLGIGEKDGYWTFAFAGTSDGVGIEARPLFGIIVLIFASVISFLTQQQLSSLYMMPFDACIKEEVEEQSWYAQYNLHVSDLVMPGARENVDPHPQYRTTLWRSILPILPASARLHDMVTRILTFEALEYRFKENALVARKVAAASAVIVKNLNGVLPLRNEVGVRVSKLGEDARAPRELMGRLRRGGGLGLLDFGIFTRGDNMDITSFFDNNDLDRAKELAADSDIAIVFGNSEAGEMILWNVVEGNWGDRNDLKLWHTADALSMRLISLAVPMTQEIEAVVSVNKRTIVVLHTVGPVDMPWFNHPNISAVVYAMLPGQESGSALADILFGNTNPSGRLPFTALKNRAEYTTDVLCTSFAYTPQIDYSDRLYIDYRHADKFNITPVIPFGHGLSYIEFEYSNLSLSALEGRGSEFRNILVSLSNENIGPLDGHEVVQLYVSTHEPPKILEGFEKVWVPVGQSVDVEFRLVAKDLRVWDLKKDGWVKVGGRYGFLVRASSRDIRVEKELVWDPE
ncbi:UNVERIFIED_CONTAM: hypothetical protein HDU68_010715 [Siphonaria sp. JEL0065]|nr:hypothetical protein HDU68_010715 [Siphonaria sp. JEL0065]